MQIKEHMYRVLLITIGVLLAFYVGYKIDYIYTLGYVTLRKLADAREEIMIALMPLIAFWVDSIEKDNNIIMKNETTSGKVASLAGRTLRNPKASKEEKQIAASALTQVADKTTVEITTLNDRLETLFAMLAELNNYSRQLGHPIKKIIFTANKNNRNTKTKIQYWKKHNSVIEENHCNYNVPACDIGKNLGK